MIGGPGDQVDPGDPGGERRSGLAQHGAGGTVLDDPSGLEHDHPVGQGQRVDQVVGDDQRRPRRAGPVAQHLPEQLPQRGGDRTSSAAIGSSSSSRAGFAASARAIAIRCACPPDSCAGRRSANSVASTAGSHCSATFSRPGARRALAARAERHVRRRGQVREQQRLLGEQHHPALVRRHPHLTVVSTSTSPSRMIRPESGRINPEISDSSVDFPAPLRAEHGDHFARVGPRVSRSMPRSASVAGTSSAPVSRSHRPGCVSVTTTLRCALPRVASTISTATTTNTRDNATAASGSALPLQVDLQRQRPGDALQASGERQRGTELAERPGERQHRTGDQPRQHQRDGDPAEHGRRIRTEGSGHRLVTAARRTQRSLQAQAPERAGRRRSAR